MEKNTSLHYWIYIKQKNEQFINEVISYLKANEISEDDFFSWWNNQDFTDEELFSFQEDTMGIKI